MDPISRGMELRQAMPMAEERRAMAAAMEKVSFKACMPLAMMPSQKLNSRVFRMTGGPTCTPPKVVFSPPEGKRGPRPSRRLRGRNVADTGRPCGDGKGGKDSVESGMYGGMS